MEGFFVLIFIGFVFYSLIKADAKTSIKQPMSKTSSQSSDVPDALRAKWARQDQNKRKTQMAQVSAASKTGHTVWKTAKGTSENLQRQSRRAQSRNKAQSDMFSQSGTGRPVDKNPHRRADWGREGHFKAGWMQPALISIISAAALAGLFAVT